MEISMPRWFSEFGMEDPALKYNQDYQMNPLECYFVDDLQFQSINNIFNSQTTHQLSSGSSETTQSSIDQRPVKQLKTNNWSPAFATNNYSKPSTSSSSCIISFENSNPQLGSSQKCKIEMTSESILNNNWYDGSDQRAEGSLKRNAIDAFDHVMAERKRRERLSQKFIALSAVIPGLKKTDKASILGEAVKYLKQLEERVKTLEEQTAKKTMESIVLKRSQLVDDDLSSSDENSDGDHKQSLPEIEARVCDKDVLIRILCENRKGCLLNILSQVERLGLSAISSNVLPFGRSTLDIAIVAQMEPDYCVTMKDLVKNLRHRLL